MKDICPKECPLRDPYCHINCPQHQRYRQRNEKNKKERKSEIAVIVYQCDQKNRFIRDRRNHRLFRKETDK